MSAASQRLPPRENAIFKKVVKSYECKQYKNALKYCRQILSNPKFSEHGETLAMKGLVLNSVGKKGEANDFVKRGLKNDLRSHVCWHVYGLVHRTNKKYDEAVKCYRNALRWDKENIQIYRDLSIVQLQMREIEGFRDARYNLLKLRPSQQSSWVGYSLAYYLLKDYYMALKVISEYRKTMIVSKAPQEYGEVVLYEVMVMMEAGNYEDALGHLAQFESDICDVLALKEAQGSIYMKLKRFSKAECVYRELINRNHENYTYLCNLEQCLGLDSESAMMTLYRELGLKYPRSHVIRRKPLLFTSGDTFWGLIDHFLQTSLKKAVPSIFVSIKVHYDNPEKVIVIEELITGYIDCLRSCERLRQDASGPVEPPSTLLWAIVLLAQHFDALKDSSRAIELIDGAISHTPTDMQLYMIKAKIYKHAGDLVEAAKWMEEARSLDTADRFVNCKCVKYIFRINEIDRAIDVAGLFTREGPPPLETMDDMQCMWFQTEMAQAYHRLNKLGEALKNLHEIDKHFADIIEDQFDFHSYCMRKITLRSYIGVLRLEDKLRLHPFYIEAAKTAIEIYLFLHDNPGAKTGAMNGPLDNASELSASELKKIQRKERKAHLKAQAKAQEEKKENKSQKGAEQERLSPDDNKVKFIAKDLLNVDNPLDEAIKFLIPLQTLSSNRILPHLLAYAIHSRRRKFLLMLQSIKRVQAVDPGNGELHSIIVDFILTYEARKPELPPPVQAVIDSTRPILTEGKSLVDLNQEYLQRHQDSLDHMIPACPVLYRLQPDSKDAAIGYITNLSGTIKGRTIKNCVKVVNLLESDAFGPPDSSLVKIYKEKCGKLFPFATPFRGSLVPEPTTPSLSVAQVKEVAAKNISVSDGGAGFILKATALSLAAMSDLSGDINDDINDDPLNSGKK